MKSSSKYLEQFERVKRWYERFKLIDSGRPYDISLEHYRDEVYAFFQNCHHLKDWIRNDSTVGAAAWKVEEFIDKNEELKLCADICNRKKHLKLRSSRSGQDPRFGKRDLKLKLEEPDGKKTISVKFSVNTSSGKRIDAFELATRCLQAWEDFIKSEIHDENSK